MLPSPQEIEYFLEVAHTLNISRASERLGVSQPTLSLAIQRLERSMGIPLLLRGKGGVQLTKAGQRLFREGRELVQHWKRLRAESLKEETEVSGHYTLGCHVSVGAFSLPHLLPALLSKYKNLELKLIHDLSRKITEEVVSFRADFGIVVNPVEHPDLIIKTLVHDEVMLWHKPGSTSDDPTLFIEPDLLQTQALMKQLDRKGLSFRRVVTTSSLEVITQVVAAGGGVAILPSRVATHVKALGLKPYKEDQSPKFNDKICLVYRADTQKSEASRGLGREIESILKAHWKSH